MGEINLVFYADDGKIVWQEHEWVLDAMAVTVAMLCTIELESDINKTKPMVCPPRLVEWKWGGTAYH